MSDKKVFVGDWLVGTIQNYHRDHGVPASNTEINRLHKFLYRTYPEISQRTLRQAALAVREDNYRTKLVSGHYMAMPSYGIVPKRFSKKAEYIERMKELIAQCAHNRRRIRVANVQDGHREHSDPALWDLMLMVMEDFDPDYVPMMCDMVDNTLFADYTHGTSYYQAGVKTEDGEPEDSPTSKAMIAFEEGVLDYACAVRQIVRKETITPTWLGNHEVWILRYLHQNEHGLGYFFENFFPKIAKYDVLWTDGDTHKELPITDNVIAIHGWASRNSYPGATAVAYMRQYDSNLSVFAGHSHRQETIWTRPHPHTGGQNFINICGTLGDLRAAYAQYGYSGHNWGFSLAEIMPHGNIGHSITDVRVYYREGFYECNYNGKLYRNRATKEPNFVNPFREVEPTWKTE